MTFNIKIIPFLDFVNNKNGSKLRRLTTDSIYNSFLLLVDYFKNSHIFDLKTVFERIDFKPCAFSREF